MLKVIYEIIFIYVINKFVENITLIYIMDISFKLILFLLRNKFAFKICFRSFEKKKLYFYCLSWKIIYVSCYNNAK